MTAERRFIERGTSRLKLEKREDGTRVLIGYAAVYYRAGDAGTEYELWSGAVERIMPGAFDRAIREKDDCRGLFNHDSNQILGRTASGTCRLSADATGLRFELDLPDTQAGRDVAVSIERGDVTGCSFSFLPERVVWIEEGDKEIRQIEGVELFDVGPVTYPAYKATNVSVRSEDVDAIRREHDERRATADEEADAVEVRRRLVEING